MLEGNPRRGQRETVLILDEYGGTRMVRSEDWKYVSRVNDGPVELYDLTKDPQERRNLSQERSCRSIAQDLQAVLHDWFASRVEPGRDAWQRSVSGRGQLRPVIAGSDDASTYYSGADERRLPR